MPKEYIKRDLAMQCVYQYLMEQTVSKYATSELCFATREGISMALEVLDDVPAADVAPVVHGEWEPYQPPNESRQVGWICTNCSSVIRDLSNGDTDFCPHCGAKMDGGKE